MAGCVVRAGNRHFLHKTHITRQTLLDVAERLGIPEAVRDEIRYSGEWIHIYSGEAPSARPSPRAGRRTRK